MERRPGERRAMPPSPPHLPPPPTPHPSQALSPLVSSGSLSPSDVFVVLREAAGAAPTAVLMAGVLAAGAGGAQRAGVLAAAAAHAGGAGLLPLCGAPTPGGLRKAREALRGDAELEAAFPELSALEEALAEVSRLAPGEAPSLAQRAARLPPPCAPHFARGALAGAVEAAIARAGAEAPEIAAALAPAAGALRELLAAAGGEAAALEALHAVQVAVAGAIARGEADEALTLAAFQALEQAGIIAAPVFKAWLQGPGEPYGRAAALTQAEGWVAKL